MARPCALPIRASRRQAGIGVVHQERNLVTRFSVAENIMLERLGTHALSRIDYDALYDEAARWLKLLDLDVDPATARIAAERRPDATRGNRQGAVAAIARAAARRTDRIPDPE